MAGALGLKTGSELAQKRALIEFGKFQSWDVFKSALIDYHGLITEKVLQTVGFNFA